MLVNMKEMLMMANKEKYAVAQFNINNLEWTRFVLEECEENENESEYLFSTERRSYRKMQNKTIQDAINKIAARTNIRKNVTPHVFRHTFATLAMENGIELGDLQQLLGHVNPATTIRYSEVSEERKRNAHKRFVK